MSRKRINFSLVLTGLKKYLIDLDVNDYQIVEIYTLKILKQKTAIIMKEHYSKYLGKRKEDIGTKQSESIFVEYLFKVSFIV